MVFDSNIPNTVYFERYSQQFTTAFIWSILFRIFGSTNIMIIKYFNILCNGLTVIAIYLVSTEISKKYNVNKILAILLIATFLTLPLLSIFVYGDMQGIGIAMLSVYFIMKYVRTKKESYALISAIFLSIAYMIRMNILIFIIASIMYLILDIITSKKEREQIIKKILIIIGFIVIVFVPNVLTKNYYLKKYDLNKENGFPTSGWVYMGMQEGFSSSGWYNYNIAKYAYEDIEFAKIVYDFAVDYRMQYFLENPKIMAEFYAKKLVSMWAENSYAGIHYNLSQNFIKGNEKNVEEIDGILKKSKPAIYIYQKALILIIFGSSIIVIWKNRKDISNEVIFLLTIFIGGFLFQMMWEAKSRYIIPYIVVLIPIASIMINKDKKEKNNELTKQTNID